MASYVETHVASADRCVEDANRLVTYTSSISKRSRETKEQNKRPTLISPCLDLTSELGRDARNSYFQKGDAKGCCKRISSEVWEFTGTRKDEETEESWKPNSTKIGVQSGGEVSSRTPHPTGALRANPKALAVSPR